MIDRPDIVIVTGGRVLTVVMPRSHAKTGRHGSEPLQGHRERYDKQQ
jgi:hypothetical protein